MDNQTIKQRPKDTATDTNPDKDTPSPDTTMDKPGTYKTTVRLRRDKRMAMAKRGLRSLTIAVTIPLTLTILNIYLLGTTRTRYYAAVSKPNASYIFPPPLWVLHVSALASAFLMGLSAWLVWAEGGLHRNPMAIYLYLTQLVLGLVWDVSVFALDAPWVGLVVCLGMVGALVGCYRNFKGVNPMAGNLVKPCLAWAAFIAVVNLKLLFL